MRSHIDWLTFTFAPLYISGTEEGYTQALADGLREMFGMKTWVDVFDGAWEKQDHGRAPYSDCWTNKDTSISIFASSTLSHSCCEISGAGCEILLQAGNMEAILGACADHVTRIDIASDIDTPTTPTSFVACLSHGRMRSSGSQISETGETQYLGSKKSDRYCRVYRYAEPHPRSRLLRVECVFRKDYAKAVSRGVLSSGIDSVAKAAGDAFGFSHPDWKPEEVENTPDLSVAKAETGGGGTVMWLVKSVAPAFKRLVANGTIPNERAFVERYFLTE